MCVRQELLSDFKSPMLEASLEVEIFTTPESPKADISGVEEHGGPTLYQFKLLATAPVMPGAGSLGGKHVIKIAL